MIVIEQSGEFKKTEDFLKKLSNRDISRILHKYGREGVTALANATPIDSGKTAGSWDYDVRITKNSATIYWLNSNINNGVPIAILLQYGHGTRNGGYVKGRDYINPALKPILDRLANEVWTEVTKL